MRGDDAGVGLVPVLTTRAGAASRLDLDVGFPELELGAGVEIEDRNGDRRGVDPSTFLGGRDALVAMAPGFVSEELFGSLALEQDSDESRPVV